MPSELIKKFIQKYPILLYEYNINGEKLSTQEIDLKLKENLELINSLPESIEEFQKSQKIINFYVNYIKDMHKSEKIDEFELSRSLFF